MTTQVFKTEKLPAIQHREISELPVYELSALHRGNSYSLGTVFGIGEYRRQYYFLGAGHCVRNAPLFVERYGERFPLRVVHRSRDCDAAVLCSPKWIGGALPLALAPKQFHFARAVGFTESGETSVHAKSEITPAISLLHQGIRKGGIGPGMSGGPILAKDKAIGMLITSGDKNSEFIPSSTLRKVVGQALGGLPFAQQGWDEQFELMDKQRDLMCEIHALSNGRRGRVDKSRRILHGVVVACAVEFRDGRGSFNEDSLKATVDLINKSRRGEVKGRFGHSMFEDPIGRFLGWFKNARLSWAQFDGREVKAVRADLHVFDQADSSPLGKIGGYVLKLAAEDPDAVCASMECQLANIGRPRDGILKPTAIHAIALIGSEGAVTSTLF